MIEMVVEIIIEGIMLGIDENFENLGNWFYFIIHYILIPINYYHKLLNIIILIILTINKNISIIKKK